MADEDHEGRIVNADNSGSSMGKSRSIFMTVNKHAVDVFLRS